MSRRSIPTDRVLDVGPSLGQTRGVTQGFEAREAILTLDRLVLPNRLSVARIILKFPGPRVEATPFSLALSQGSELTAELLFSDLAQWLSTDAPKLVPDASLQRSSAGGLQVAGRAPLLVPVRFSAELGLSIQEGTKLNLRLEKLNGVGALTNWARGLLEKANPIFDLKSLKLEGRLVEARVDSDRVVLRAKFDSASFPPL